MFIQDDSKEPVGLNPERARRITVLVCSTRYNSENVFYGNSIRGNDALVFRIPSHFSEVLRRSFFQPEWMPQHDSIQKQVSQLMTNFVGDIVRRLVLRHNKDSVRTSQNIRGTVFVDSGIGRSDRRRRRKKIFAVFQKQNLDRKLSFRDNSKSVLKRRNPLLQIRHQTAAFRFSRIGEQNEVSRCDLKPADILCLPTPWQSKHQQCTGERPERIHARIIGQIPSTQIKSHAIQN